MPAQTFNIKIIGLPIIFLSELKKEQCKIFPIFLVLLNFVTKKLNTFSVNYLCLYLVAKNIF